MKRIVLAALLIAGFKDMHAQTMTDTVSVGAAYASQVWYSLANDEQGSAPKNNWDLAFDASGFGSTILINSITGTTLYRYPHADITGWSTVDTTGLSTWPTRWNSDTSWAYGAMGRYADAASPYDLDWGIYNVTTHVVTGDSIYIIKLADGSYKKLAIESLSGNVYSFKYANIDGSGLQSATLDKTAYTGKNFGYYSLQTNAAISREPATPWDLLFTQYTAFVPSAYTVTGILANKGVTVAKCINIADVAAYTAWPSATFGSPINTIGYNWKTFTGTAYEVQDSTVFFVKPVDGTIWKLILTGFGGSSTGNFIFSKEKLYTPPSTAIPAVENTVLPALALYPNPSQSGNVNIVYSFPATSGPAMLTISDITGKIMLSGDLDTTGGLHQYLLPAHTLLPGTYIVSAGTGNNHTQQKLTIQ